MKLGAGALGVAMACTTLAACASSSAATGPVTLNFYSFNDPSGAVQSAVANCSKQSNGKYTISYNKLPPRPTTSGCSWCGGWRRRTRRWTSSAST